MKKQISILLAAMAFMTIASAQPELGLAGGATLSNYRITYDSESESFDSKLGFTVGMVVNLPAGRNFAVQPCLYWTQKGMKEKQSDIGTTYKMSLINNYVEIPVNFLYTRNGFFGGAGPSIGFGIKGKWKYQLDDEKETESVNFGNDDEDDMKGLDIGANILAGYKFPSGFLVMLNFNQGLSNLVPGETEGAKLKSHYFGIRIGYMLKTKK